ncbi:hypothetical protein L596_010898 [Steinernema carpocapsae]|uniref:Uncharacterized protein n=1 Tax=Steinernema carpocapsae TaxID=34508 RepID=A0A4U5PJP2_STECR|nr:hypothetical protein L596_010898 [Steinernema carpocapsae]
MCRLSCLVIPKKLCSADKTLFLLLFWSVCPTDLIHVACSLRGGRLCGLAAPPLEYLSCKVFDISASF